MTDMDHTDGELEGLPASTTSTGGRAMSIAGGICALLAPAAWVLGLVGLVLGALAHAKSDRFGLPVAIASALTMIAGMVLLGLAVT